MRLLIILFSFLTFLFIVPATFAQTPAAKSAVTKIQASVGKYYFSISGLASPFASIVMSSGGFFQASTVADNKGEFKINDVFVNEGFSEFCLETIDQKRIGDSYACIKIEPLKADGRKDKILLPPTLGLSGKTIRIGSSVFASGYSMPSSSIRIEITDGLFIDIKTDSLGFYKSEVKDVPAGKYFLIASANYQGSASEKSLRGKELESISIPKLILQNLPKFLLIVLLVPLVIILLIILISKRARRKIKNYLLDKGVLKRKEDKRGLHHEWFIGF